MYNVFQNATKIHFAYDIVTGNSRLI